jgi:hypothetical protein
MPHCSKSFVVTSGLAIHGVKFLSSFDQTLRILTDSKNSIFSALEEVEKVNASYFNSMIVQMFANAKRDELVEMWKLGTKAQKDRVIQIMSKIDPANGGRYREIGG